MLCVLIIFKLFARCFNFIIVFEDEVDFLLENVVVKVKVLRELDCMKFKVFKWFNSVIVLFVLFIFVYMFIAYD